MRNWNDYLPSRSHVGRFFKYAFLLIALSINLKIVFDGFSYYLARRSLDTELEVEEAIKPRVSRRAAEARARLHHRYPRDALHRAFSARDLPHSRCGKAQGSSIKPTRLRSRSKTTSSTSSDEWRRRRTDPSQFVDLESLKKEVNKVTFVFSAIDRSLKPTDTGKANEPTYQTAAKNVIERLKKDRETQILSAATRQARRTPP